MTRKNRHKRKTLRKKAIKRRHMRGGDDYITPSSSAVTASSNTNYSAQPASSSMWDSLKSTYDSAVQSANQSYQSMSAPSSSSPSSSSTSTSWFGSLFKKKDETTLPTTQPQQSSSWFGGRRTRRRHHRGGMFKAYSPYTTASQISGIRTAQPLNWVGGKRRTRRIRRR